MNRALTQHEIERLRSFPTSDSTRLFGSRFREWQAEELRAQERQDAEELMCTLWAALAGGSLTRPPRFIYCRALRDIEPGQLVTSADVEIVPTLKLSEQIAAMEAEIEEIKQSPAEWRPRTAPTR